MTLHSSSSSSGGGGGGSSALHASKKLTCGDPGVVTQVPAPVGCSHVSHVVAALHSGAGKEMHTQISCTCSQGEDVRAAGGMGTTGQSCRLPGHHPASPQPSHPAAHAWHSPGSCRGGRPQHTSHTGTGRDLVTRHWPPPPHHPCCHLPLRPRCRLAVRRCGRGPGRPHSPATAAAAAAGGLLAAAPAGLWRRAGPWRPVRARAATAAGGSGCAARRMPGRAACPGRCQVGNGGRTKQTEAVLQAKGVGLKTTSILTKQTERSRQVAGGRHVHTLLPNCTHMSSIACVHPPT